MFAEKGVLLRWMVTRVVVQQPPVREKGTGILMLNMGGPRTTKDVGSFLLRLFQDKDILQLPFQKQLGRWIASRRTPAIQKKYAEIGGGSPIYSWTDKQGTLMCQQLDKISPETAPHKHYVGFRYADPLTEDSLDTMERDGVTRAVAFSQYPQYSCATAGSSVHALHQYYANKKTGIQWSIIDRWGTNRLLVKTIALRIQDQLEKFEPSERSRVVILFSAHSLPMKAVNRGDPYTTEVAATVQLVMEELKFCNPYRLVWQSKVGPVPWLEPSTENAIKSLAKKRQKNMILVPVAFTNEHIETLHELDIEYAHDLGKEVGANIKRAESPNDHPLFIQGLAEIVAEHLKSKVAVTPQLLMTCPLCERPTCRETKKWLWSLNQTHVVIFMLMLRAGSKMLLANILPTLVSDYQLLTEEWKNSMVEQRRGAASWGALPGGSLDRKPVAAPLKSPSQVQGSPPSTPEIPGITTIEPHNLVESDLHDFVKDIRRELGGRHLELCDVAAYYFDGQGKAVRPLISILMARAINAHLHGNNSFILPGQKQLSLVSEMIHTATLVHDDVIDTSDTRRGKPSVNALFGQKKAIIGGDYILAKAGAMIAQLNVDEITHIFAQVLEDLVQGEFMQMGANEGNTERFAHYIGKTFNKTASLLAYSCKGVAIIGGADDSLAEMAFQYGKHVGIAFQLIDDFLDFVSSTSTMGKPTAADLHLGLATAPVLFAAQKHPELNAMIERRFSEAGDVEKALDCVHNSDGLEQTKCLAQKYCLEAVRYISILRDSPYQKGLITITDKVLNRSK